MERTSYAVSMISSIIKGEIVLCVYVNVHLVTHSENNIVKMYITDMLFRKRFLITDKYQLISRSIIKLDLQIQCLKNQVSVNSYPTPQRKIIQMAHHPLKRFMQKIPTTRKMINQRENNQFLLIMVSIIHRRTIQHQKLITIFDMELF